jgi:hypothetical protein
MLKFLLKIPALLPQIAKIGQYILIIIEALDLIDNKIKEVKDQRKVEPSKDKKNVDS